jgi:hypothetical protein
MREFDAVAFCPRNEFLFRTAIFRRCESPGLREMGYKKERDKARDEMISRMRRGEKERERRQEEEKE